jgi:hypothetical protein
LGADPLASQATEGSVTHSDLVNSILLELAPIGLCWNNNTGALRDKTDRLVRYGLPGSADILACIKGRFVSIECKVGRDFIRKNQRDFAGAVARNGGIYILARTVDDVANRLKLEGLA